ncbi:MAG: hypothetical protein ACRD2I_15170 [Vicinamibacterales bacterium]
MDPERWRRIDGLLQAALDMPSEQREEFLRDACANDPGLQRELRSLLVAHQNAGAFLGTPAIALAARDLGERHGASTSEGGDDLIG